MKTTIFLLSLFVSGQLLYGQTPSPQIGYYPNGQKKFENYSISAGDTSCKNKEWFEDGTVSYEQSKTGCTCISTRYYKNGKVESMTEETPAFDRETNECIGYQLIKVNNYCDNGQLTEKTDHSIKGKKQFIIFGCNGDTLIQGTVIDNFMNKTGHWIYLWENLNKKTEGEYKDTNILEEANIKIGKWTYWSDAGKIVLEQWYDDKGQLIKENKN